MQVIQEALDDMKKLESKIDSYSEIDMGKDDDAFLRASIAQSKAIAGLALAIKEVGLPDPARSLTKHAVDSLALELLRQVIDDLQYNGHHISESLRKRICAVLGTPDRN